MNHEYEDLNESDEAINETDDDELRIKDLKQTVELNAEMIEKSTSEMFNLLDKYSKREKQLKRDLRACQRENEILKSRLQKQLFEKKQDTAPVVTQIVKTPTRITGPVLTPIGRFSPTIRQPKRQGRSMKLGDKSVIVKPRVSPTMMTRRRARTLSQQTVAASSQLGLLNTLTQLRLESDNEL